MTPTIRLAAEADAAAVQAVYAPYVHSTAISFELEPPDVDEMRERIHNTLILFPWLVCEEGENVLGYAYASKHRERSAYQWSVDVSVYVAPGLHRRGMGRTLYAALFMLLRQQGFYNAFAGIALPNEASIGLHRALGFRPVGIYRQVGYKLGKWHDVAWLGLALQAPAETPHPPRPLSGILDRPEAQMAFKTDLLLLKR
jgi:L-amino acid N-acyltransferase YncA